MITYPVLSTEEETDSPEFYRGKGGLWGGVAPAMEDAPNALVNNRKRPNKN